MNNEILIIGAGVVDIPLNPIDAGVFSRGSTPLEEIRMGTGGDALNEAIVLSRLGHRAALASKLGCDAAGDHLLNEMRRFGIDTSNVIREEGLLTAINIVLVDPDGERRFITNRNGSLRRLALPDVLPALSSPAAQDVKIVCLASTFVSPMLSADDMACLMRAAKAKGCLTCADTTRPKNGETVRDIAELLSVLDYYFPNLEEARALTGESDPDAVADAFLEAGLKHIVLKMGGQGCLIADGQTRRIVPACRGVRCIDTTGAGDTFSAAFMAALLEGKSFEDCAAYANAAASLCVEQTGATTAELTPALVRERLSRA